MPDVKLDTGFNIEIVLPVTPFHKRLIAWAIDLLIQIAYLLIADKLIAGLLKKDWSEKYPWLAVIFFLPVFLYHLVAETSMNGQSPGKKALGIKIITLEGGQPSLSQYIIRWIFRTIDSFAGLICIIFTRASQRIGDLLAGTVLIDTKTSTSWQDTVFVEVEHDYQPVFPQVMQLTDRDINTIKQVLATAHLVFDNNEYVENIAYKLKNALKIETDINSIEFMELLLKDYNHLSTK